LKFEQLNSKRNEISSPPKRMHPLAGKEFVKIVTRDGVRMLLVPSKTPNSYPDYWPERELTRLQEKAKVLTVEDQIADMQKRSVINQKLKQESELRKQKLREIDVAKVCKMSEEQKELSLNDEMDNIKILDRAFLAKQEQVRLSVLRLSKAAKGFATKTLSRRQLSRSLSQALNLHSHRFSISSHSTPAPVP